MKEKTKDIVGCDGSYDGGCVSGGGGAADYDYDKTQKYTGQNSNHLLLLRID